MPRPSDPPIGLVVEGPSEYHALPQLLAKLSVRHTTPSSCDGFGAYAAPEAIARRALRHLRAQATKDIRRLLFVLDRESRPDCAPAFAETVREAVKKEAGPEWRGIDKPLVVVCCDRTIENWIIADPTGIRSHKSMGKDLSRRVGSQADGKDAVQMLKSASARGFHYQKGWMAGELAARVRVNARQVQRRSRSLRKLLKECGVL